MHFTKHYLFLFVTVSAEFKTVDVSCGLFLDVIFPLEIKRTYDRSIERFVVFHSGQAWMDKKFKLLSVLMERSLVT